MARASGQPLRIDGSHGEGGGQILRTALALAALGGRAVEIVDIRAGRPKPGLAAQHLTAIRAAAALCDAALEGDALGSPRLRFAPRKPVEAGDHVFDVAEARAGGSAGSAILVLHTVLLPLAMAAGPSRIAIRGGTHVPWSPSADYARDVWLPALAEMGVAAALELDGWGWYPRGGGEVRIRIEGKGRTLRPIDRRERGPLGRLWGRAVVANLPETIAARMAGHASSMLRVHGIEADIAAEVVDAPGPGAGIFLAAGYAGARAGFGAIGRRGLPAEAVAEEAIDGFLAFHRSAAAVDAHLADQLVLPAALASGTSSYSVERVTRHLTTNCWLVEQFGAARATIAGAPAAPGHVTISPCGADA
ncbi:MAG: RNA 3'-phosphate cyclase [Alphaproteobacteria bacterium]|nr:RNA 3'-phosphate cyclase [Alphaproteobacteria bacterium]